MLSIRYLWTGSKLFEVVASEAPGMTMRDVLRNLNQTCGLAFEEDACGLAFEEDAGPRRPLFRRTLF